MKHKILFLCTGNYYRSRFAELFFNALASKVDLGWHAISRGLATELSGNIGPISSLVLRKLNALGVATGGDIRMPIQLKNTDLTESDLVIALDAREHKPYMMERFAQWADRIVYWNVPDLHLMTGEDALSRIENHVTELVEELRKQTLPS